ncbi:adenosylcobinamide-phosphate synthase CbiB [Dongia sedimenti]|uniref:Cobalamin biosynthesis protein CobD n=1 Tax=Dongia sedimenti TaxID=3064282 RepID=A0ABU0YR05_9PROT|nr:adenosylcobinamide-phosphate synthase CbiB [Rhodospirillaceae bacterium R-7]
MIQSWLAWSEPLSLLIALGIDAWYGDPVALYRKVPHPVVVIGTVIAWADRRFNRESDAPRRRRNAGIALVVLLVAAALLVGAALQALLLRLPLGWLWLAVVMSAFIAQRSLYGHVADVARAIEVSGLEGGRLAVAKIVGRDPNRLDRGGVSRAAIESLAENFSDAVVAPVFWALALGLPGLIAYKAINTADSMIGHRSPRHRDFGWAAARLDDVVNWPAARLAALLMALGALLLPGADAPQAFAVTARDARSHRSPNAGWPEAALAGALGFTLNGPRAYHGVPTEEPWTNAAGRKVLDAPDIWQALRLYLRACLWLGAGIAAVAVIAH